MSNILTIGLITEGSTDQRLLQGLVARCFGEAVMGCTFEVEVYPVIPIEGAGATFVEKTQNAAIEAAKRGVMVLCVQADADNLSDKHAFDTRISPARKAIAKYEGTDICRYMVPIVPIQMIESWMLADETVLTEEIGTKLNAADLGIDKPPEQYADPKFVIEEAIRIAYEKLPRRRRRQLSISELYLPIGQQSKLEQLRLLSSFQQFETAIRDALKQLNYLH